MNQPSDPAFHLRLVGVVMVGLACLHVTFPRRFGWTAQLAGLSLINRQLMKVHTFFVGWMVLLMGVLCLTQASELADTTLGKRISLGLGLFWGARWYVQHFVYSPELWRGKRFETGIHVVFSLVWAWMTLIFLWTWARA